MKTPPAIGQPDRELPDAWGVRIGSDPVADVLVDAYERLGSEPLAAARIAEHCFSELGGAGGLLPYLAFVIAVSGRIQSLSDFHGLDPLMGYVEQHRAALRAPEAVLDRIDVCYFGSLVFRRPDHPSIGRWATRCERLVDAEPDSPQPERDPDVRLAAANYLVLYRIWSGDLIGAEVLASRAAALRDRSLEVHARLLCHSMNSMILRLFLRYEACLHEIREGLRLAQDTGVRIWDSHFHMQGAFLALTRENLVEAREWLELMAVSAAPEHYLDRSGYHYCRAWLHALLHEMPLAERHARESVELAQCSGAVFPQAITHVGLAQLHLEQRHVGSGLYHLVRARRIGRRMETGGLPIQFIRGLLTAHFSFRLGMQGRGYRALRQTFRIGREQHYLNFPWWRADLVSGLCARALDAGIETDYALTLVRLRRLRPPVSLKRHDRWYFPLHVDVLSGGRVRIDDRELRLGRQSLALLLALCCLADAEGWVERDRLARVLWPDSTLERAQQALDTGVHRMRRKFGTERLVRSRTGGLGLDPGYCRIDYWRLQQVLQRSAPRAGDLALLTDALERSRDVSHPLIASLLPLDSLRERTATKALTVIQVARMPSAEERPWLERLVLANPGNERLWQALIRHHVEQGMMNEAVAAWERCCQALGRQAAGEPSPALRVLIGRAGTP